MCAVLFVDGIVTGFSCSVSVGRGDQRDEEDNSWDGGLVYKIVKSEKQNHFIH